MEITAAMVRELREKTGLPMMECKKALTESGGDMASAIEFLKKAGSAKISKMASRETSQGRIACFLDPQAKVAGICELLCETAPVANTDDFISLASMIAAQAAKMDAPTPETVMQQPSTKDASQTIDDYKAEVFNRLRENIQLKRVASLKGDIAGYVHHNAQVGVIVKFTGPCPEELGADVCMHITAMNPPYLNREQVNPAQVAEERARFEEEAQGKPAEIAAKMVEGKLGRWYGEIVLLEQAFVKDDKKTVGKALKEASPDLSVEAFLRFQIGG